MTAHEIAAQLSRIARSVLVSAGSSRQGAVVVIAQGPIQRKLMELGLIGKGNGLTARGTVVRQIVVTQMEEDAFA